jgi:hypothetical protein
MFTEAAMTTFSKAVVSHITKPPTLITTIVGIIQKIGHCPVTV